MGNGLTDRERLLFSSNRDAGSRTYLYQQLVESALTLSSEREPLACYSAPRLQASPAIEPFFGTKILSGERMQLGSAPHAKPTTVKMNPTATPAEKKQITRNRASYSCQTCRKRKIKCDKVRRIAFLVCAF